MSRGHEVKGVRRIDRGLEQPHKFQIEGDKLLVILRFLLQTDGRPQLLDGRHLLGQVLEGDEDLAVVEAFR